MERWLAGDLAMDLTSNDTNPGDENYGVPDGLVNGTDLSSWGDQNARAYTPSGSGITTEEVNNPFGYAGYLNMDRNRYLARHRVYRSDLGRWMQRDPIGYVDGMSLYEYVGSRLVKFSDPLGLKLWVNPKDKDGNKKILDTLRPFVPGVQINPRTGEVTIDTNNNPNPCDPCLSILSQLIESDQTFVVTPIPGRKDITTPGDPRGEGGGGVVWNPNPTQGVMNPGQPPRTVQPWERLWHELKHLEGLANGEHPWSKEHPKCFGLNPDQKDALLPAEEDRTIHGVNDIRDWVRNNPDSGIAPVRDRDPATRSTHFPPRRRR